MQRLNKIVPVLMLGLLIQACGGPVPEVMDRSSDLQAPLSILEADLPGCEVLTTEMVTGQDAKLIQHPTSSDLVVLMVDQNKPVCVDTIMGVKARLAALNALPAGAPFPGVLPETEGDEGDEGEGEGREGEGDTGSEGKNPGPLKHSMTIKTHTLVSDDPIPIFLTSSTK